MENIKTVEDAFIACGMDPKASPDVSSFPEELRKYMLNHFELLMITKAINKREDGTFWQPDWNNSSQWKYFPWFEIKADKGSPWGFGFSLTYYGYGYSVTAGGSRLCFSSSEDALYAAKQFEEHYEINLLMLK